MRARVFLARVLRAPITRSVIARIGITRSVIACIGITRSVIARTGITRLAIAYTGIALAAATTTARAAFAFVAAPITARATFALVAAACSANAMTLASTSSAPQQPQKVLDVPAVFEGEGALQNDTFLPSSVAAAKMIAEGDRAFAKARPHSIGAGGASASGTLDTALDAWHAALAAGALDDAIAADADARTTLGELARDPDGSLARGAQSIQSAVVRRLNSLDPKLVAAWSARFEPLAARDLEACGGSLERLARVEHDHPMTRGAVLACLRLFDLSFEEDRAELARAWLGRAREHATALAPKVAALEAALERRRRALRDEPPRDTAPWSFARRLRMIAQVPLRTPPADEARARALRNRTPRAGIAFVGERALAVQCADALYLVDEADSGANNAASATPRVKSYDLSACAAELSLSFAPTFTDPRSDLAARPVVRGQRIVVVAGRALAARGNALVCLERNGAGEVHAVWGYADQSRHLAGSAVRPLEEAFDPGVWEFEPGPAIDGSSVIVEMRRWSGEDARAASVDEGKTEAWCAAFDLDTGAVRWKRSIATGAVLPASDGAVGPRSSESRAAARPAAFLAVAEGHVFANTGLGVAALLDSADGRLLWSVRSARRASEGARHEVPIAPVLVRECGSSAEPAAHWLWAPEDGNSIYRLRDGADVDGHGIFVMPPERLRPLETLLGGDACRWIVCDAANTGHGLAVADPTTGARAIAAPFEREESTPAEVMLAPDRALFATDRALYWCDRSAELAWIDRIALPGAGRREQPALAVRRDRIYAADSSSLWIFTSR
jgi:hypothetical protein